MIGNDEFHVYYKYKPINGIMVMFFEGTIFMFYLLFITKPNISPFKLYTFGVLDLNIST